MINDNYDGKFYEVGSFYTMRDRVREERSVETIEIVKDFQDFGSLFSGLSDAACNNLDDEVIEEVSKYLY